MPEIAELAPREGLGRLDAVGVARRRAPEERASLVELPRLAALELATRRLREQPWSQRDDVIDGEPEGLLDDAANLALIMAALDLIGLAE